MLFALVALVVFVQVGPLVAAQHYRAKTWHTQMLELVNKARASSGLPPMCLNIKLIQAAQKHSNWMAKSGQLSHFEDGGPTNELGERMTLEGFKWSNAAENAAAGLTSVVKVMDSWMNSPGHKDNILGDNKFAGFGFQKGIEFHQNGATFPGTYWTQVFGSGDQEACTP